MKSPEIAKIVGKLDKKPSSCLPRASGASDDCVEIVKSTVNTTTSDYQHRQLVGTVQKCLTDFFKKDMLTTANWISNLLYVSDLAGKFLSDESSRVLGYVQNIRV